MQQRLNPRAFLGHRPRSFRKRKASHVFDEVGPDLMPPAENKRRWSHRRTWERFMVELFGKLDLQVRSLPLTPNAVKLVTRKMREAGYRSCQNFLTSMRRFHLEAGHAWCPQLQLAYSDAMRFARRKLGPPRRSKEYDCRLVALAFAIGIMIPSSIVAVHHVLVLAALFMLRAAEVGQLNLEDVAIDIHSKQVAVKLSHSKCDATARGYRCRWSCICASPFVRQHATAWMLCPFHAMWDYARLAHKFVHPSAAGFALLGGASPLFLNGNKRVDAQALARALKQLDLRHSIQRPETLPRMGPSCSFGGHSARRTGCQLWFRRGLPEAVIRRLARWRSDIIEIYLAAAPLEDLGTHSFQSDCLAPGAVSMEFLLSEIRKIVGDHLAALKLDGPSQRPKGLKILLSKISGNQVRVHEVVHLRGRSTEWKTRCGFYFGRPSSLAHVELEDSTRDEVKAGSFGCVCTAGCFR